MELSDREWHLLEGIVRRYLGDAKPAEYDDYRERRELCERILGRNEAVRITGTVRSGNADRDCSTDSGLPCSQCA